jgi:hypothetical protein
MTVSTRGRTSVVIDQGFVGGASRSPLSNYTSRGSSSLLMLIAGVIWLEDADMRRVAVWSIGLKTVR